MSTTTRNRVDKGVSTGGQFAKENKPEASGVSLNPGIPKWEQHALCVEDAAARAGFVHGQEFDYNSTSLQHDPNGALEAAINVTGGGKRSQIVHNFRSGETSRINWSGSSGARSTDPADIKEITMDINPDRGHTPKAMFDSLRAEAAKEDGLALKTEPRSFNTYAARVGDTVTITRDGKDIDMTVSHITPAGVGGSSFARGPSIGAHIRPGGYGISFDAQSKDDFNARVVPQPIVEPAP